jgi:hypothetical protein
MKKPPTRSTSTPDAVPRSDQATAERIHIVPEYIWPIEAER